MHLRTPFWRLVATCVVAVGTVLGGPAATRPAGASTTNGRVAVFGDSLAVQAGPYLARAAKALHVKLTIYAFPGTAPCDFLGVLDDVLTSKDPDIVLFAFRGNSFVTCMLDGSGQPLAGDAVIAKYRADLEAAADQTVRANRPLILASPPAARGMHELWQQLDDLYRQIAATHPGVQYVDAGTDIAPGGQFAATQPCLARERKHPPGKSRCRSAGSRIAVRSRDGLHFCGRSLTRPPLRCPSYSSGALRYARNLVGAAEQAVRERARLTGAPTRTG